MRNKLFTLIALLGWVATGLFAQLNTTAPPPPGVTQLGFSQTGTTGFVQYYYQVVVNYPSGSVIGGIVSVPTSNGTLTGGNYNTISWTGLPGALSYEVLRFTTTAGYTGTCTCAVGSTTAPTVTINDQSNTLSSYTAPAGAVAASMQFFINTRDHAGPEMRWVNLGTGLDRPTSTNELDSIPVQKVAGSGGTTASTLVKIVIASGAPTMVTLTTSDTAPGVYYGVANDTALAGSRIDVAVAGTAPCLADSGGMVAGDLVIVSTVTAGDCEDSGQTSLSSSALIGKAVIGRAQTAVTGAGSFSMALIGAGGSVSGGGGSITGGTCTNQVVTAMSSAGAPTCTTVTATQADSTFTKTISYAMTLTNLQSLNTVPFQILPAVAGTAYVMGPCILNLTYGSAAYSGGGTVSIGYGTSSSPATNSTIASTVFTTFTASHGVIVEPTALAVTATTSFAGAGVFMTAASGNFTGGTGGTGQLSCQYSAIGGVS